MTRRAALLICALPLCGCSLFIDDIDFASAGLDGGPDATASARDGGDSGLRDAAADANGSCTTEVCDGLDNDCDGDTDEAAATLACGTPDGVQAVACAAAVCTITACEADVDDCDDEFATGCEADLTSLAHCGNCSTTCAWECSGGNCNDATSITAGESHGCVARDDGTVACWGNNTQMQLGDGTMTTRERAIVVPGVVDVLSVSGGSMHTCALVSGGTIRCWGENGTGQLGDGSTTDRGTAGPVVVGLTAPATQLASGRSHNCVVMTTGGVRCWGNNSSGQIGDGSTTIRSTAIPAMGLSSGVTAVVVGSSHSCALLTTRRVKCWGNNSNGQLGDGSTTRSLVPIDVMGLSSVDVITAGGAHTCALRSDGTVWCWGRNMYGELGNGTFDNASVPTQVSGLAGVIDIAAGSTFTCALRSDGTAACWGNNEFGQLGDGSTSQRSEPVDVIGLVDASRISLGRDHSCVLRGRGRPACWGDNSNGQLGDGSRFPRSGVVNVFSPI